MLKHLITFAVFGLLFWSCQKIDLQSNYPTIINKLPAETLSGDRQAFSSNNPYLISSLNKFGFCGYADELLNVDTPKVLEPLTESEAIEIVKNFVTNNPSATGVKKPDDLTFSQIFSDAGYYDGGTAWVLKATNQIVDTIDVMYSEIIFMIRNRELTTCVGNWFPEIYIPEKFNIDREKASSRLLNKVVGHSTIAGEIYYVTISKADLDGSTIKLKILPVTSDIKIELRICWQFDIPGPVFYKIYVDVMSGEIVGQEPTIIS